jgi:hypothetical protein
VRLHFGGLSSSFATGDVSFVARGCSAVGSASPCQGEGRGFESRHPLEGAVASTPAVEWPSGEATACKAVHTGSIPVSTSKKDPARLAQRESASLTRKRSLVQSQYRAPSSTCGYGSRRPRVAAAASRSAALGSKPRTATYRKGTGRYSLPGSATCTATASDCECDAVTYAPATVRISNGHALSPNQVLVGLKPYDKGTMVAQSHA